MQGIDTSLLARQLVRALRGRRSQTALSRRLGYGSNVVYTWESGRRDPAASELFRLVRRTGGDPRASWSGFQVALDGVDLERPEGVAALLDQLRGEARIVDVAERCGASRYTTSRWLRGLTEPRLSQLLLLVEALTFRLLDFVAALVPPASIPMLQGPWRELEARRRVAFTHPWSQALLRLIETEDYRATGRSRPGWIARRLGIDRADEEACIVALRDAGLIRWTGRRWEGEPVAVDTSMASEEERRAAKLHWAELGRSRIAAGADGLYSWAVVALSRADYEQLRALHVRYMKTLRQLVDASAPSEVVAVANVQLFELDGG